MKTSRDKKTIVMVNKTDVADDRMVEAMQEQMGIRETCRLWSPQ